MDVAWEIAVRARSLLSKNAKDFAELGRKNGMNEAPLTQEL